jgi:hypothetical protein
MPAGTSKRCIAMVSKRWAPDGERRCNHDTSRGEYCWQHLKQLEGLRIMKDGKDRSLVTTIPRHKGDLITPDVGEFAQPAIRPNAKGRKKLKATKDIAKNTEVTVPVIFKARPEPVKRRRLIKPVYVEPEPYVPKPRVIKPRVPKSPKPKGPKLLPISMKALPKTPEERSIDSLIDRLNVLEKLWNSERMARLLKIPVVRRDIRLPPLGPKRLGQLMKLYRIERQAWIAHVNKGPYQMTDEKAMGIIDKMVKKQ